jgi:hypothetical protein
MTEARISEISSECIRSSRCVGPGSLGQVPEFATLVIGQDVQVSGMESVSVALHLVPLAGEVFDVWVWLGPPEQLRIPITGWATQDGLQRIEA